MILGIGNDIIEVGRIRTVLNRHPYRFLNRIFTHTEQTYCSKHKDPVIHFSGRFAAKEAIVKALGIGFNHGITWLDIEICNDSNGKPVVYFSSFLKELCHNPFVLVSISHCREYATAFAVWTTLPSTIS